jgi:hypothetical protein
MSTSFLESKIAKLTESGESETQPETTSENVSEQSETESPAAIEPEEQKEAQTENPTKESAPDPEEEIRAKRRQLFEEKLQKLREDRRAKRLAEEAAEAKKQAEEAKAAAERERAEIAEGRKDFRKFFELNGMDARKAYEEMTKQALEAGTPEAQIRAMQEAWKAEIEAIKREFAESTKGLREQLEQMKAREAELVRQAHERAVFDAYMQAVEKDEFVDLRAEYGDQDIYSLLRDWDSNPDAFYAAAETHGIALSTPGQGFTVEEALRVIKAAHEKDLALKAERRSKLGKTRTGGITPPSAAQNGASGASAPKTPGQPTITNDLVSSRASPGRRMSLEERTEAIIRRYEGR